MKKKTPSWINSQEKDPGRSPATIYCQNSLGFLCASFEIRFIFSRRVLKFYQYLLIIGTPDSMSGDYQLTLKTFSFQLSIRVEWVYWVGRHVGTGVVVHLGIRVRTPCWALLVGYTPALAPLWRHLTPVLERELGRVAGGRFRRYWDRSNIPQRKRRMKCGIMGNWRCISDRAKCPYLRTHSVGLNALFRRVEWKCVT